MPKKSSQLHGLGSIDDGSPYVGQVEAYTSMCESPSRFLLEGCENSDSTSSQFSKAMEASLIVDVAAD